MIAFLRHSPPHAQNTREAMICTIHDLNEIAKPVFHAGNESVHPMHGFTQCTLNTKNALLDMKL
jgi:hypothetical protein